MERAVGYFDRFELFQNKNRQPERIATEPLKSVATQVDDWYDGFWDISMKYCEGDVRAAEHFMDTSVFMFYYRIKQKADWVEWHHKQVKGDDV
ncbi:MAG: hypothetical protein KDC11_04775 [Chitinophagaceae bacterium]|nr:hypothetical protein [Chitinophagaceae bacterium]